MLLFERRNWIEEQILKNGKVDIDDLSKQLDVSGMTIRRDLAELEKLGKVIRTHGGAISPESLIREVPYSSKAEKNIVKKMQIALKALTVIPENANIILDSGTTTLELAKLLKNREDVTVITNDIKIAVELIESNLKVIVTGGELQNNVGALHGWTTQEFLKNIHVDIFFLGSHAIDLQAGITVPTFEKAYIKKLMIDAAESTWALVDSTKFGKKALSSVCSISRLDGIITDENLDTSEIEKYEEQVLINIAGGN